MSLHEALQSFVIPAPNNPRRVFGGVDKSVTLFLRFTDQAEQEAAFEAVGFPLLRPEGRALPPDFHWPGVGDVSIIGLIFNDDAVIGEEGEIVTPATQVPGWHVNVLLA